MTAMRLAFTMARVKQAMTKARRTGTLGAQQTQTRRTNSPLKENPHGTRTHTR